MRQLATLCIATAVMLSACATAPTHRVSEAAPIVHKVGQSGLNVASSPRIAPRPAPAVIEPRDRVVAAPQLPTRLPDVEHSVPEMDEMFDPQDVDTELYAHQRVGRTYKVFGKSYTPRHDPDYDETGIASWYGPKFHGRPTALGEPFDMHGMTAAHKTLPLNSLVRVTNLTTGKSMTLRVNDRGPFVDGRIIDLSKGAAVELGLLEDGLKRVRVQYAGPADPNDLDGAVSRMVDNATSVPDAPPTEQPEAERVADTQTYMSLRALGATEPEQVKAPITSAPKTAPFIAPVPQTAAPAFDPLPDVRPDEADGPLTLTIKGPIHLAQSKRIHRPERIIAATHD